MSDRCGLVFEPDDVVIVTVTALAKAAPYTEIATPAYPGVMVARGGCGGVFLTRKGDRTGKPMEAAPGRLIRLSGSSLLFGFQAAGAYGPTLYLECYRKHDDQTWKDFLEMVDLVAGGKVPAGAPSPSAGLGSDVTLGAFTADNTAGGTQIFLAGSVMPVGGATVPCTVLLNTAGGNTQEVYVGETSALAVATNNAINPAGQDVWQIPAGGTLWFKAPTAAVQTLGARVRS